MKRLLDAAKGGRYGQRDHLMLLMAGCVAKNIFERDSYSRAFR